MGAGPGLPGMGQLPGAGAPGAGLPGQQLPTDAVGAPPGEIGGLPEFYDYGEKGVGGGGLPGGGELPPDADPGFTPETPDLGAPGTPGIDVDVEEFLPDKPEPLLEEGPEVGPPDDPDQALKDYYEKYQQQQDKQKDYYEALKKDPGAYGDIPEQAKKVMDQAEWDAMSMSQKMESQLSDYLAQATGIPEEQLQGQIAQLQMASSDQMAKFAQQMAAHGVGASGLVGQGMGQIASQTLGAIANLRFENAKLALDERLNKMKAYMGMYGQMMSEENRMAIFDKMNELEQTKFGYQQEQDRIESDWNEVANLPALMQADGGWDSDAWAWAFGQVTEEKMPANEIMKNITVDPSTGKLVKKDPALGTEGAEGGGGTAPSGYGPDGKPLITEGTWKEKSDKAALAAFEYVQAWYAGQGQKMTGGWHKGSAPGTASMDHWAKQQGYESWQHFYKQFIG